MRRANGFTLVELLVVVGIIGLLAAILVPTLQQANELTNRTVCMSNLKSIGSALTLYKGSNDNQWPWLAPIKASKPGCTGWETNKVGLNRAVASDPNTAPERSLTGLMFLLVRDNQPAKLFICPSSTTDSKDDNIKDTVNATANQEPDYFWDFSSFSNVSYSWQSPIQDKNGHYVQGLNDNDNDTVVIADKSPEYGPDTWDNGSWNPSLTGTKLQAHNSQNHSRGAALNALFVGINVQKSQRPDIGTNHDMIYTSSSLTNLGSQSATGISMASHKSTRDTFLWGPVSGGSDANSGGTGS